MFALTNLTMLSTGGEGAPRLCSVETAPRAQGGFARREHIAALGTTDLDHRIDVAADGGAAEFVRFADGRAAAHGRIEHDHVREGAVFVELIVKGSAAVVE